MLKGLTHTFAAVSEWVYFLLILQLSWLVGSLLGGIVLGVFPATYAVFSVARKRLRNPDVRVWQEFWTMYKATFLRSQLDDWIWVFIGIFIYYDIRLLFAYQNITGFIIGSLFVSILMIYGMITMLILPIRSRYRIKISDCLRLALVIAITFPHISLGLSVSTIIIYFIATKLPILFLLTGVSSIALLYTYLANFSFKQVETKGYIKSDYIQE